MPTKVYRPTVPTKAYRPTLAKTDRIVYRVASDGTYVPTDQTYRNPINVGKSENVEEETIEWLPNTLVENE